MTAVFPFKAGRKRVLASTNGYGFVVPGGRAHRQPQGRQGRAEHRRRRERCCAWRRRATSWRVLGENGKALIFPLSELPEMPRGKGVKLQSYREGGLQDGLVFTEAEGRHLARKRRPQAPVAGLARLGRAQGLGRQAAPRAG